MGQKLHKFRAATYDEAYRSMRRKLGDAAIIMRATEVKEGGVLGFLGRKLIELTAAAPEPKAPNVTPKRSVPEQRYREAASAGSDKNVSDSVAFFQKLVSDAQQRMAAGETASAPESAAATPIPARTGVDPVVPFKRTKKGPVEELRRDLTEIREMLQVLVAESPGAGMPTEFAPHYRGLVEGGVSRKIAASLVSSVAKNGDLNVLRDPRVFAERLKFEVRKHISVSGGISLVGGTCKVVALVGATGVGKTTNAAKLAALFAVRERARVALVTSDTYRVAAPEQLRVYANIIGLPMTIVNDAREMASALRTLQGYDLVLIDTAGGSHFNTSQIEELRTVLGAAQPEETLLVLSANTQAGELRNQVARFSPLKPTSLLFSKLDETERHGSLLSIALEARLPLSYFSVGQSVPDDIVLAHPGRVAELILKGGKNRGGSSAKAS